jgi:hypothetical protein
MGLDCGAVGQDSPAGSGLDSGTVDQATSGMGVDQRLLAVFGFLIVQRDCVKIPR